MYEFLKDLLPVAELVGDPQKISCYTDDQIWGNVIQIEGTTPAGMEFSLELEIKKVKSDDES